MPLPVTPTHTRRLTVCNRSMPRARARYVACPELRICGKWLAAQGFRSGQVVDVTCEASRLVITLAESQPPESP